MRRLVTVSSPRRCVCPGSFDPVTLGHVDVISRAAALYDEVIVATLHNPDKSGTFSVDERQEMLTTCFADLPNVTVRAWANTLIVDVCREVGAGVIVKGLRSETDYAYEVTMALMNRNLSGVETFFLPGDPHLSHLSSSLVKQVVSLGGDVEGMVPSAVLGPLVSRLAPKGDER